MEHRGQHCPNYLILLPGLYSINTQIDLVHYTAKINNGDNALLPQHAQFLINKQRYFSTVYIVATDYNGMISTFPYILKNILVEKLPNHLCNFTEYCFKVSSFQCQGLTVITCLRLVRLRKVIRPPVHLRSMSSHHFPKQLFK